MQLASRTWFQNRSLMIEEKGRRGRREGRKEKEEEEEEEEEALREE